ncbi:MAG: dihydrofolate reductase family protein [Bacteroidota bacterium]
MREIITYIAVSADLKIADKSGSVDWLNAFDPPEGEDYGYAAFYGSIDTVIMGNATYKHVVEMGVPNPYPEKINYVFTRNSTDQQNEEYVEYIDDDLIDFVKELKHEEGKAIWCVGGGQIISQLLQHRLIDKFYIHIMPVLLGEGIPLYSGAFEFHKLKLENSKQYSNGVLEVHYLLNP